MLAGKTWDEWIAQYAKSHQHPVNKICHTIGIPLIAAGFLLYDRFCLQGVDGFSRIARSTHPRSSQRA